MILVVGIAIIISIWYLQKKKQPDFDHLNNEIYKVATNMNSEIQKLFHTIQMKPTATGAFGENIADIVLSHLPKTMVTSQYRPKDIRGSKIDFVVKLPNSDLLLPIDSKFTIPEDLGDIENLDKKKINALNKFALNQASKIEKYISSKETTDFVLMFLPDYVYGILEPDTFDKLAHKKVVPTNSSGLLSTIFMINMQHRFTELNSSASKFADIQMKTSQGLKSVIDNMQKGLTKILQCQNNISDAMSEIVAIKNIVETLESEEVID